MKIRKRDGTTAEVGDSHILADGETLVVELAFMDGRPGLVHDGLGNPAGERPGFLYSDGNEQAERALAEAYQQYARDVSERWRQGPGQRSHQTQSNPPQVFDSPQAAVADAYAQYNRDIQERWRR